MRRFLTLLGIALIVLPEPITTVPGVITLFLALRLGRGRRRSLVNSSGVIIRSGKLPPDRLAYCSSGAKIGTG